MKGIIYCRQSSGDDSISESVELQKVKCIELCKKENINIVNICQDLNTSGKTYPTGSEDIGNLDIAFQKWYKDQTGRKMYRDGLGKVIKELSNIDYIICYDVTRLSGYCYI